MISDFVDSELKGKIYAAFLMQDSSFNAKPLFASLLQLDAAADGLNWSRIKAAALRDGRGFWSPIVLADGIVKPAKEVEALFLEWVKKRAARFFDYLQRPQVG